MMKLHVQINGKTLVALVDMGSTHTFMNVAVVPHLGLPVMPRLGLFVKVANGECMASPGICAAADMVIDAEHFSTNLYVLPLDGFDVILGMQWLRTLGPIVWDFGALTMSFWRQGRTVWWTGVGGTSPRYTIITAPCAFLDTLLESFFDIFEEQCGLPLVHHHDHCI
jgi:hypothetical protein